MSLPQEHLLERLVHHVLRDDPLPGRRLIADALEHGHDAEKLLADVLWPAAECVHQLRGDRLLSAREFNLAVRGITAMAGQLASWLPRASAEDGPAGRLLVLSAPGERSDLGAHLFATLAEAHAFTVLFAGAGVSTEELSFALTRLEPDAVVIHGSRAAARPGVGRLMAHLRRARFWPAVQMAAVGAMVQGRPETLPVDLASQHPLELLELLALCPEYRAPLSERPGAGQGEALQMMTGTTPFDAALFQDFLARQAPRRLNLN